ncbi:hypothetical protein CVH10_12860 [Halomonas sp. ND22Bw]|uniref:hypothetical protein n=1 Tax=Halomonas sp. ND22Bw TaxID=2054178 RepID=UPI000D0B4917|nr:hypothetical protein CVH10_12860 [Halomonas sp. ND22Bw]
MESQQLDNPFDELTGMLEDGDLLGLLRHWRDREVFVPVMVHPDTGCRLPYIQHDEPDTPFAIAACDRASVERMLESGGATHEFEVHAFSLFKLCRDCLYNGVTHIGLIGSEFMLDQTALSFFAHSALVETPDEGAMRVRCSLVTDKPVRTPLEKHAKRLAQVWERFSVGPDGISGDLDGLWVVHDAGAAVLHKPEGGEEVLRDQLAPCDAALFDQWDEAIPDYVALAQDASVPEEAATSSASASSDVDHDTRVLVLLARWGVILLGIGLIAWAVS